MDPPIIAQCAAMALAPAYAAVAQPFRLGYASGRRYREELPRAGDSQQLPPDHALLGAAAPANDGCDGESDEEHAIDASIRQWRRGTPKVDCP